MLYVILFLLKIIGTTLLILLSLLLLMILSVLFVPIRYRIHAEHGDTIFAEGRVSWLLHIIHMHFIYRDEKFRLKFRAFGFLIYDSLRPKKGKISKKVKRADGKNENHKKKKKNNHSSQTEQNIKDKKKEIIKADTIHSETLKVQSLIQPNDQAEQRPVGGDLPVLNVKPEGDDRFEEEYSGKRRSFSLRRFFEGIKKQKDNVISFFKEVVIKLQVFFQKTADIKEKFGLISDFIHNDQNKEAFHLAFSGIKKVLKHILPGKLKSQLVFGTGDPCSTGQMLGILGIAYSFYGDKVQITPDFVNSRFEGKHDIRGRIRLVTILIIVIKLILDKRFKELKKNFILLKEAL